MEAEEIARVSVQSWWRCRLVVACVLAAAVPGAGSAAAQQQGGTLQGSVLEEEGRPLVGAAVVLIELQRRTITDRAGGFTFAGVPEGSYTLRVRLPGFSQLQRSVTLEGPGQAVRVALTLERSVFELEEVVVSASPLDSPVGYQAGQALGREALQRRAATSLGEMLDGEPGVAMRSFGAATARPVIRGLDGDRVLVLENGERMGDLQETAADHAISLDPLATARVEVVRGPASLLYGSSALGGVVNLFSDDLPRQWSPGSSGDVALQGATVNGLGAVYGRLLHAGETWAASGRYSHRAAGNLRTPEGRLPGTYSAVSAATAGFGFAAEDAEGGLSLGFHRNDYGIPDAVDAPHEEVEIRTGRVTAQGRAAWQGGGFARGMELRFAASRFAQQEVLTENLPGVGPRRTVDLEFLQHTLSSTLTVRHAPVAFLDAGAIGFSGFGRQLEVGGDQAFTPGARSAALAVFTFQEIPLPASIRVQFGGRLEEQSTEPLANAHFDDVPARRATRTFSGALGLNARPRPGVEIGGQLARAHRTPTLEELYADGPHLGAGAYEIGDPALAAEIGKGFDVFLRLAASRTRLEVSGFVNRIENFIIFQPTGEMEAGSALPVFRYEADDALLTGGEATVETLVGSALRVRLGGDYVRGSRRDGAGTPLPFMPPPRGRVALTYSPQRWWAGAETRLVAPQHRVAPDEERTEGYVLVGFDFGYRLDGVGEHLVTLRLDNALNTAYRDHLSRVEDRGFPMPGRSLNLVYRWAF